MTEQPMTGEEHGNAACVGFVDDLLISNGATGLNNGRSSSLGCLLQAVFEREEGIGSQHAVLRTLTCSTRGDFHGLDATGLSGADTDRGRALNHHDGVGFDLFTNANSEFHAVDLFLRWLRISHRCGFLPIDDRRFFGLNQNAALDGFAHHLAFKRR